MNPAPLCESALDASAGIEITSQDRWLVVSFARDVRACSWAIVGGGLGVTRHVVWHQVEDLELRPPVDPAGLLRERLRERDLMPAIGLLTSRSLAAYQDVSAAFGGVNARCVATVGLGNALRAGDPPGVAARIGTINLLVHVSVPLGNNALLEAMTIASEAKAIAVAEAGIKSRATGLAATGTGTDCTVVTSSLERTRSAARYAGKHTALGAAIGAATHAAVHAGVRAWLEERRA